MRLHLCRVKFSRSLHRNFYFGSSWANGADWVGNCLCLVAALHLQPVSLPGTALSSCSSMTHHPCTFWRGQTCSCSQARQEGVHSHSKAETKEATSRHGHTEDGKEKLRGIASLPLILLFWIPPNSLTTFEQGSNNQKVFRTRISIQF